MDQVAAEAQAEGSPLGEIKRRIDGKGVVLFTLEDGGMIRDTGKEVFFSPHDSQAEHVATRYAEKKWGKDIRMEENRIHRNEGQEQRHEMEREQRKGMER